jgi:hypothetical protein
MRDELTDLLEAAFIQQQVHPFPGGELALLVLRGDAIGSAAQAGLGRSWHPSVSKCSFMIGPGVTRW